MSKSMIFSGQPIFGQLLNLIPNHIFCDLEKKHLANRYYKKFDARHHLVTMLYTVISQCTSIREVITGLQVAAQKSGHFKMTYDVCRSTLSDANAHRSEAFFGDLFHALYIYYYGFPDSRKINKHTPYEKRLFIIDSTTITLFQDILKGAGATPANGKRKGGLKAHIMINAEEDTPCMAVLTKGSENDKIIFKSIDLKRGSILTFDKGYASFKQFDKWTKEGVTWVSRVLPFWIANEYKQRRVSDDQRKQGVISDTLVVLGDPKNNKTLKIKARIIKYYDSESDRIFEFVTNNTKFSASKIAGIYKRRWQIELLFKRIKQKYPLRYFLGDNPNAIKIQVWCALIADLLIKIIKDRVTKRKWSYSNVASIIRLHLMTYVNLQLFLENPDRALKNYHPPEPILQLKLFNYG